MQIVAGGTRPCIAKLGIIHLEGPRIANLAGIVVEACLAVVDTSLAFILGIRVVAVWALINAGRCGGYSACINEQHVTLSAFRAMCRVVAFLTLGQTRQTLPVVSVVRREISRLALVHAKDLCLSIAIRQVFKFKRVHVPAVITDCAGVLIGALIAARRTTSTEKIVDVLRVLVVTIWALFFALKVDVVVPDLISWRCLYLSAKRALRGCLTEKTLIRAGLAHV